MTRRNAVLWMLLAAGSFHVAHLLSHGGYFLVGFFLGLVNIARIGNARHAFRWGIVLGWLIYVPHLLFLWRIFVPGDAPVGQQVMGAVGVAALWMVLPIWLGLFLSLAAWLRRWTRPVVWIGLIPVAWLGIEYFRSELYPLKFSWLSTGYAFAEATWLAPLHLLGMYGCGAVLLLVACALARIWNHSRALAVSMAAVAMGLFGFLGWVSSPHNPRGDGMTVAVSGVQLEFPSNHRILEQLDHLITNHPETELMVLSEYTFDGPVPASVREWCREHQRHLVAGGKDPVGTTNFYNTAFVIGTDGAVIFKQAKGVPIQFFMDGLPARAERVWDSPWGALGLCICYDLGYTRVIDELVRQDAKAIIAPTMDVAEWGGYQHWLHSRVAPVRAAEYGIPVFRLTSSGISQHVLASGEVAQSCPFPGQGEHLVARLALGGEGRLPLDRRVALACVALTGVLALGAAVHGLRGALRRPDPGAAAATATRS